MGKLSLKVVVAGRTYPLTLNEGEQEKVLKAADDINKAINFLDWKPKTDRIQGLRKTIIYFEEIL